MDLARFGDDMEYACEVIAEQGAEISRLQQEVAKHSAKHRMYERMWIKERRANITLREIVRDFEALVEAMEQSGLVDVAFETRSLEPASVSRLMGRARMLGAGTDRKQHEKELD